jgi:RsiW-degrading membrane proteinase PrsW (M82 family)
VWFTIRDEQNVIRKYCWSRWYSTTSSSASFWGLVDSVKEAFVTLVKPTPPVVSPSGVVYNKMTPFTSVTKYLVIGMILFLIGMIFSTTGLFLTTSIWILISISFAPLLYVFWMYKQDRFEREPTELIVLSFGWGSFFGFPDTDDVGIHFS